MKTTTETPRLEIRAGWNGNVQHFCPVCRTNGNGDHVPDSADCHTMKFEREWSIGHDE